MIARMKTNPLGQNLYMVNVLKFRKFSLCWFSRLEISKYLSVWQTGMTLIRLPLGLLCLSRLFWQATSVKNFRAFTVI